MEDLLSEDSPLEGSSSEDLPSEDLPFIIEVPGQATARVLHPIPLSLILEEPSIHVVLVVGWKGVGRRALIEGLVKDIARRNVLRFTWSEISNENRLNPEKLQRRMMEQLQDTSNMKRNVKDHFWEIWYRDKEVPLVILENVLGCIEWKHWKEAEIPTPKEIDSWTSKQWSISWLISSPSNEVLSGMKPDLIIEYPELTLSDAWDLLLIEAAYIADSLNFSGVNEFVVLECFFYTLLYSFDDVDADTGGIQDEELVRQWVAEGLISHGSDLGRDGPSANGGNLQQPWQQIHQQKMLDEEEEAELAAEEATTLIITGMNLLKELLLCSMLELQEFPTRSRCITISRHVRLQASKLVSKDHAGRTKSSLLSKISKFLLPEEEFS